jgi:hypothetical protein
MTDTYCFVLGAISFVPPAAGSRLAARIYTGTFYEQNNIHFLEEIAMYWIVKAVESLCDMNTACRRTMKKLFRKKTNTCESIPSPSNTSESSSDSCGFNSPDVCQYGCCSMSDDFHEQLRRNSNEQKGK